MRVTARTASIRSRWLLNMVNKLTIFDIRSTKGFAGSMDSSQNKMHLFIVITPLHVINAMELRHKLGISADQCIVLHAPLHDCDNLTSMLEKTLARYSWHSTYEYTQEISPGVSRISDLSSLIGYVREMNSVIASLPHIDTLVFPHWGETFLPHIINMLKPARTIEIESGTATHRIMENRPCTPTLKDRIRNCIYTMCGIKYKKPVGGDFFTLFDLPSNGHFQFIRNDYELLRKSTLSRPTYDGKWFIGTPFVPLFGPIDTYIKILKRVRDSLGYFPKYYIPHPREKDEHTAEIAKTLGTTTRRNSLPVELNLLEQTTLPHEIVSVGSSASFSCAKIFPQVQSTVINIPRSGIPMNSKLQYYQDHVATCCDWYQKEGVPNFKFHDE